ncbi:hypothetical protein Acsp05_04760 [Actinokineospora sp. NBRC 105648]|nr:hypothetical protein Acsp05_04760 [Actinokineospora sp. NBRC 105648]
MATATAVIGALVVGGAYWVGRTDGAAMPETPGTTVTTGISGGPVRLVGYDSCDAALADLRRAALDRVSAWGLDGEPVPMDAMPAPAQDSAGAPGVAERSAAPDQGHSTTNNHETAADEPDLVKTDGRRIVTVIDGNLRVVDTVTRALTATLALPAGEPAALLLEDDRALVMVRTSGAGDVPSTTLVHVDLTGGARVVGTLAVDGGYLDGRQVGTVARIVLRSRPRLEFTHPTGGDDTAEALRRNREVINQAGIDRWLPGFRLDADGEHDSGRLVDCADVRRPADYTGTSLLTVLSLDLRAPLGQGDPLAVAADGDTVYGTATSLYVADDQWSRSGILPSFGRRKPAPDTARTEIHQFDITRSGKPVYTASGSVDGSLLNQYSLSEHEGALRVATTTEDPARCCDRTPGSESAVSVLERRGADLVVIGTVGGLGRGERIHSVRYVGDTAYLVTFRRTDPLYTLDLGDPAHPRVTGELKITGYSAYLHPVAEGRLLGVGQEATERGRATGTQVSLFDTTSPAARRVAQFQLPGTSSAAEFDPHAFLFWPERGLVVLPLRSSVERGGAGSALVLRIAGDQLVEVGRVAHPPTGHANPRVQRSLVAAGALWTVSGNGLLASDLDTAAQLAWLPFG